MISPYPITPAQQSRWIVERRGPKNLLNPLLPYAFLHEDEAHTDGQPISTATIFLTNRECPFRCLMCDLWQNTLDMRVPPGAIPAQIRHALERLPAVRAIKLYNAGSFFDPQAIPPEDHAEIAGLVNGFERVIVESHPAFLRGEFGQRALHFQTNLRGQLEIAIGLETAHPPTLEKLNKRMSVEDFQEAAEFLKFNGIDLRVFLLLRPPFMTDAEGLEWAYRSLELAAACGARVCSIIPTRGGNGALEALGEAYLSPKLRSLEAAVEYGLSLRAFCVYADLWDVEKFFDCECSAARAARLAEMNKAQLVVPAVTCFRCSTDEK